MIRAVSRNVVQRMSHFTRFFSISLTVLMLIGVLGCTSSREITVNADPEQTTTTEEPIDDDALGSGVEGIAQLQALVDRLLADDDVCSVLAQRNSDSNQLDPSLFLSTRARQVLTKGLVQIMDHLISISDASIRSAFETQKAAFVQVLDVVDRFANNPNDPRSVSAIQSLVQAPDFVQSQQVISQWSAANCK